MSLVMVLDCGATNVRAIAVDDKGQVAASHHLANVTHPDPNNSQYQIWDVETIWQKLTLCCQKVTDQLGNHTIDGLTVTTFGVDGAPVDQQGNQLYPVISWKCPRTQPIMEKLDEYLGDKASSQAFYQENGVGMYSFNTLFKLLWLKEHEPSVYRRMDKFLFISSIFNQRLTGRQTTDLTMAGTSMMTALTRQSWHNSALGLLGLNQDHFPDTVAPGEVIGQLTPAAARQLGLKPGIAVVSSGHDTQFALFGSGASLNQPVLSSGTWEILMTRVNQVNLTPEHRDLGITTEWDAETARYNPGLQWLGSGALEWLTNLLFPELKDSPVRYKKMIDEALQNSPGAGGVRFTPPLSLGRDGHSGMLSGMSIRATRGQIYRAALESMALQTRRGLSTLEELGDFQTQSLICVGGGSRNGLWNQIRADVLGKPVEVVSQAETTVLGAAMFAFSGIGRFASAQNAQQQMAPIRQRILPGAQTSDYARLFPI